MRTETDLRAVLDEMAAQKPTNRRELGDLDARRRRTANRRGLTVVTVAAVAVVVILVSVWAVLTPNRIARPSAPQPTDGPTWIMRYRAKPPTGWQISRQAVYRDTEQTALRQSAGDGSCDIIVDPTGKTAPPANGTTLTLGGRHGTFVPATGEQNASFWWLDDLGAAATASCARVADPEASIAAIVPGLVADRHAIVLPFTLASLPAGIEIKSVYDDVDTGTRGVELGDTGGQARGGGGLGVYLWDQDPLRVPSKVGGPGEKVSVAGRPAVFIAWNNSLCFEGRPTVCAGDTSGTAATTPSANGQMQQVFAAIKPTANLADQSTWLTADQALPR